MQKGSWGNGMPRVEGAEAAQSSGLGTMSCTARSGVTPNVADEKHEPGAVAPLLEAIKLTALCSTEG